LSCGFGGRSRSGGSFFILALSTSTTAATASSSSRLVRLTELSLCLQSIDSSDDMELKLLFFGGVKFFVKYTSQAAVYRRR
jgi:hypothetical protein